MRTFSSFHTFQFSWNQVSEAFWHRYPNPQAKHVLSEDTVARSLEDGKLFTKRLITKKGSSVPKWGERFLPAGRQVCVVEESIIDPHEKTLTTYTRNIGMTRVMLIEEKCVYRPDPDNSSQTLCEREAFVTSSIFGFSRALQAFGLDRFKKSCQKTVIGYEYVLSKMFKPKEVVEQNLPLTKLTMNAEKIKSTAQKAKELAKSKAASVVVTN